MSDQQQPVLETTALRKHFPGVVALDGVDFALMPGDVHAIVGENGAGKSTLIKVLTGEYRADGGEVRFQGKPVSFAATIEAQQAGISTVYQEVNLAPQMSVAQNIFLRRQPKNRLGLVDFRRMERESRELLARFGITVDVTAPLHRLGVGVQQMVAIARGVSSDAKVVILDEPTASLEPAEVETLFRVINLLHEQGVAVIYISHKLDELFRICNAVTVLRDGKLVHAGPIAELTKVQLISHMLGRELKEDNALDAFGKHPPPADTVVLRADALSVKHAIDGISFDVRRGEVLGLGGLLGSGRTETVKAIAGALRTDSGQVSVDGEQVSRNSSASAIKAGIMLLPEDRKAEGILPHQSVRENITVALMPTISRFGIINRGKQDEIVKRYMDRLRIKASGPDQLVGTLSGGNQQKVMLARWLCMNPKVLLLDEPTRGIDIGAKAEVRGLIDELATGGLAVVIVSSELSEVLAGSDRCVVLKDGCAVGLLEGESLNEDELISLIANTASALKETKND